MAKYALRELVTENTPADDILNITVRFQSFDLLLAPNQVGHYRA